MGTLAKGYKGNTGTETIYEDEMRVFMDAITKKKKYPHSFKEELKLLKVLDAIELSNKKGKKR